MNTKAIEKEIFFKPLGCNLFGEHRKSYNPMDNSNYYNGESLFGFSITTCVSEVDGCITIELIPEKETNTAKNFITHCDMLLDDYIEDIKKMFDSLVVKYGEECDFSEENYKKWKFYIHSYISDVIRLEYLRAVNVRYEMKKSPLFPINFTLKKDE